MIRINLLPVRAAQKKERLRSQLIVLVLCVVLVLAGCFAAYMSMSLRVDDVKAEIDQKQQESNKLRKAIGEVGRFKKLQAELRGKLDVLNQLKENRSGPVRLLDELSKSIPERVWINSFSENNGNIRISGIGLNEETVADFLQRLEASPYYQSIELQVIEKTKSSGRQVEKFSIRARVEKPSEEKTGGKG